MKFIKNLVSKFSKDLVFLTLVGLYAISAVSLNLTEFALFRLATMVLLGGLIGYVTNVLAIWMLFNPKRKILGLQGVIPKRKNDIAVGFANVIQEQLINHKSIARFLESNRDVFDTIITKINESLRGGDVTLKELLGERYSDFETFVVEKAQLHRLAAEALKNVFQTQTEEELREKLNQAIEKMDLASTLWSSLEGKSLKEIFPDSHHFIMGAVERVVEDPSSMEKLRYLVEVFVFEAVKNFIEENFPILLLFSESIAKSLSEKIGQSVVDTVTEDFATRGPTYEQISKLTEKALRSKLRRIASQEDFMRFVQTSLTTLPLSSLSERLTGFVEKNGQAVVRWIVQNLSSVRVSQILSYYGTNLRNFLEALLFRNVETLVELIEKFLSNISFAEIVRNKIEAFSVEQMEEVTLQLASKELRYVELFGVPLGMIIGLVQFLALL